MPAYQHDELRVDEYWLADVSFLWRLKELVAIKNQAIYAGIGLHAAGIYERVDFQVPDDEIYGASAYLAGQTPVGTFTLGSRRHCGRMERLDLIRPAGRQGVDPERWAVPLAAAKSAHAGA